jgi:hypothetical protein
MFYILTFNTLKMACCEVCCEKYNKSTHNKVRCESSGCGYEACKVCVRTYLLGTTNDPHCMNCKNQWTSQFLVSNLNKSYMDSDYKKHRKKLLAEREISRTPELMVLVERVARIEDEEKELALLNAEYERVRKLMHEELKKVNAKRERIFRIRNGDDAEKDERKKFIMPCPGDNCKGYLSSQYKCELCKLFTCPDCFELIGYTKEDEHVCKDENIKSAELIKKETKGCPKCGVRIFKISGCDQMWCTECKVAFSWNTGKMVVNVSIHNPHYYEYMKNNNNVAVTRNPGDVLCGGLLPHNQLRFITAYLNTIDKSFANVKNFERFEKCLDTNNSVKTYIGLLNNYIDGIKNVQGNEELTFIKIFINLVSALHRLINHITNINLLECRQNVRNLLNHDNLTVDYILNKISKEKLATDIFRADHIRKKNVELLNVYELLSVVGIERFNVLYDYYNNHCTNNKSATCEKVYLDFLGQIYKFVIEYNQLIDYCNSQLIEISYTYGLTVTYISYNDYGYAIKTKKFIQSEMLESKKKQETPLLINNEASCSYINN